jgi:hypothetical protein
LVEVGAEIVVLDAKLAELPNSSASRGVVAAALKVGSAAKRLAVVTPTRKNFVLDDRAEVVSGFSLTRWLK